MTYPGGPLTPDAERDLIRRLLAGEEEAIRILYARFARPVYGLGLRLLGNPEEAEELTQDVFVALWQKAGRFDPARGRLSTWLMAIAHNLGVDHLRRGGRHAAVVSAEIEDRADPDDGGEVAALDRLAAGRLLSSLSASERELLLLAYYRGWTAREIADAGGIPLGTVKTRLRTALIKLRRTHARKEEM